jgi:hypothetical protein
MSLTGTPIAQAQTPDEDKVADLLADISPNQGDLAVVSESAVVDGAVEVDLEAGEVTIPVEPEAGIVISADGSSSTGVGLSLPDEVELEQAQFAEDGTVVYPSDDGGTQVAVQVFDDGTTVVQTIIPDASAPWEYTYDLELPEGATIALTENGGAVVQAASGEDVAAFPVVADPAWFIPVIVAIGRILVTNITRHAAAQAVARGVSQQLIRQVIKTGAKTAGNKGTTIFTSGKGKNLIRVIVDNTTGNVITVTKG